jgi:formylglycine-generating enzyme required for sulfatase activity
MKTQKVISFFLSFFLFFTTAYANNIAIHDVFVPSNSVVGSGTNATALVNFRVAWDNSWRNATNWDAAWVFVKYRKAGSNVWMHAQFANTGHTTPSGSTIQPGLVTPSTAYNATSNPAVGVFIYRNTNGSGSNNWNISLRWNIGATNGQGTEEVRVYTMEMVYVPGGSFYIGSGGTEQNSFMKSGSTAATATATLNGSSVFGISVQAKGAGYSTPPAVTITGGGGSGATARAIVTGDSITGIAVINGGTGYTSAPTVTIASPATIPFLVSDENSINFDPTPGKVWYYGNSTASKSSVPNTFPKGTTAYYCMKYEISQGMYLNFLNALTYTQQAARTAVAPNSAVGTGALSSTNENRNGLDIFKSGIPSIDTSAVYAWNLNGNSTHYEAADGVWIACNFLSWMDGLAYLDWAGLRPMTELEYEKACRGPNNPVANECVWGSSAIAASTYTLSNSGAASEVIATNYSSTLGNAAYAGTMGSINGPLRVGIFTTPTSARIHSGGSFYGIMDMSGNLWEQTVSVQGGASYTGQHGNGVVGADGNADATGWPASTGSILRGGAWNSASTSLLTTSGRDYSTVSLTNNVRNNANGFRGVRSAQ